MYLVHTIVCSVLAAGLVKATIQQGTNSFILPDSIAHICSSYTIELAISSSYLVGTAHSGTERCKRPVNGCLYIPVNI